MEDVPLTLKQIQLKLGVDQHILIHLCEKGVIEPDFQQTEGRGKWRKFSRRNLFEFAVALVFRKYEVPVATVAALVRLLRSFKQATQKMIEGFELPDYLVEKDTKLRFFLFDGEYVVFEIATTKGKSHPSLLGFNLANILKGNIKQVRVEKLDKLPTNLESYLTVNLSEIAKRIS